ncbi:MAG: RluA family pseudouridine synthase [Candidatus Cloacimonetes bacterium]|nr:RluA family pseudouridine synthase [Candidatus Cloacimonadota bacterium]
MRESQKKFKSPPKRYQPKGLSILYEDHDILVVDKISGLLTVSTEKVRENTAYYLLNEYVRKGNQKSKNRIFIVHRLDRDTSGVIVFAKNEKAKQFLQKEWKSFSKTYYAVIQGKMKEKEKIITSYLAENSIHKMYSTKDPKKGKLSQTKYKVVKESKYFTLLEIELLTGRKNQIRVHLSENGTPIVGDNVYGNLDKSAKRLTLHAASLTLFHPVTKEKMEFNSEIPQYFNSLLKLR